MQNNKQGPSPSACDELLLRELCLFEASNKAAPAQAQDQTQVKITVQPASSFRFRYEEGNPNVTIRGCNRKKYPTIEIVNFEGKASVTVSCVTIDEPYRLHPNELKNISIPDDTGVYRFEYQVKSNSKAYEIKYLSLVYVKLKDIDRSLTKRKDLGIDPFKTGFSHIGIGNEAYKTKRIDRDAFRLCFEVFFPDDPKEPLSPIVSNIIKNKKPLSRPEIIKQYPGSASVTGGTEIVLLCNKVEEDYEVVFYLEDEQMRSVWEEKATEMTVHKSTCIVLTVPPFRDPRITENVHVKVEVRSPWNNTRSNSVPFEYICISQDIKALQKQVYDLLKLYEGVVASMSNEVPVSLSVSTPHTENNAKTSQNKVLPSVYVSNTTTSTNDDLLDAYGNYATTSQSVIPVPVLESVATTGPNYVPASFQNYETNAPNKVLSPIYVSSEAAPTKDVLLGAYGNSATTSQSVVPGSVFGNVVPAMQKEISSTLQVYESDITMLSAMSTDLFPEGLNPSDILSDEKRAEYLLF